MKKSQGKSVQQWGILVNGLTAELATWRNGPSHENNFLSLNFDSKNYFWILNQNRILDISEIQNVIL